MWGFDDRKAGSRAEKGDLDRNGANAELGATRLRCKVCRLLEATLRARVVRVRFVSMVGEIVLQQPVVVWLYGHWWRGKDDGSAGTRIDTRKKLRLSKPQSGGVRLESAIGFSRWNLASTSITLLQMLWPAEPNNTIFRGKLSGSFAGSSSLLSAFESGSDGI